MKNLFALAIAAAVLAIAPANAVTLTSGSVDVSTYTIFPEEVVIDAKAGETLTITSILPSGSLPLSDFLFASHEIGAPLTTIRFGSLGPSYTFDFPAEGTWDYFVEVNPFDVRRRTALPQELEFSLSSAVPEPSTWVMLILGFAGIGCAAYRRQSKWQLGLLSS